VPTDVLTRYKTTDERKTSGSTSANKINTARSLSVHWLQSSLLHTDRAAALAWPGDRVTATLTLRAMRQLQLLYTDRTNEHVLRAVHACMLLLFPRGGIKLLSADRTNEHARRAYWVGRPDGLL